jgi:G3E family GTPase
MSDSPTRRTGLDPLAGKLPICFVTGFLGSGKTTLIAHLLKAPGMERVAVIVNEFGDVGLDHELMAASSEQISLLANGCLCCTVRTDLQETLHELFIKRRNGEIQDFDRVIIETTGLADPVPAIHALQNDGLISVQYRLDCIATVVDAVNGLHNVDTMDEARKQIAVADRLIVSKTDIATPGQIAALHHRLAELNPYATRTVAVQGAVDPDVLFDVGLSNSHPGLADMQRWLPDQPADDADAPEEGRFMGLALRDRPPSRHGDIRSFTIVPNRSFDWNTLSSTLHFLTSLRGADILRIKGLLEIDGEPGPVVVQGAQHIFHPPVVLDAWPGSNKNARLIFITRNLPREAVEALFAAVDLLDASREQT